MNFRTVKVERRGAVTHIILSRPERANRISADTLRELADACESLAGDEDTRAVVIEAEGGDFCAGWDAALLTGESVELAEAFTPVASLPQPVVAAVRGSTSSAGIELALAADVRLASRTARFSTPEASLGLLPLAGGAARLSRAVGRGAAIDLLLTGRELSAEEALNVGLVSRVVGDEELDETAAAVADRIAERGPIATRYAKEAIHRGADMTLDQALRYETDLTVVLQTTEDRAEGVRAFVEKRPPRFTGR